MTVAFMTLGCKVNQYETQAMREDFERHGFVTAPFNARADVYVINTCCVTAQSDMKSRQHLRRARAQSPDAIVAVVGCYGERALQTGSGVDCADIVLGSSGKSELCALVLKCMGDERPFTSKLDSAKFEPMTITDYADRARAVVKIQDGCDNRCAYCAIPGVRGPSRSRPADDVRYELQALSDRGFREMVLSGVEISSYGSDRGSSLLELLRAIECLPIDARVRLGSVHPAVVTPELAAHMADSRLLCPHLHISLQSGCDATLRRMNRRYTAADYAGCVALTRAALSDISITTDVIVGFPGEDEHEFAQSLEFVESIGFAKVHVFAFSARPGTAATNMPGKVTRAEKKRRSALMTAAAERTREAYMRGFIGGIADVVLETEASPGVWEGQSGHYLPVRVRMDGAHGLRVSVKLTGVGGDWLDGKAVSQGDALI